MTKHDSMGLAFLVLISASACGQAQQPLGATVASQQPQAASARVAVDSGSTQVPAPVDPASYGGPGLLVRLEPQQTSVSFTCASGTIPVSLDPAQGGNFEVDGTFRSRSGPIPAGGNPVLPAHYSGSLQSGRIQMTVTYSSADGQPMQETYAADQGQAPSFNQACAL